MLLTSTPNAYIDMLAELAANMSDAAVFSFGVP
jgi:hypothetical protein